MYPFSSIETILGLTQSFLIPKFWLQKKDTDMPIGKEHTITET